MRYGGSFYQDAFLPADAAGKHAVLIGKAASDRVPSGGEITGLPYLYGYFMDASGEQIFDYLQGDSMRLSTTETGRWGPVWGRFQVPDNTRRVRFFLNQASGATAHNGSAARFDDVGLFLFDTEQEADQFVERFRADL